MPHYEEYSARASSRLSPGGREKSGKSPFPAQKNAREEPILHNLYILLTRIILNDPL